MFYAPVVGNGTCIGILLNQCGEIKTLLKAALTDKIDNAEIYMKGVDASYSYEGYCAYRTRDLNGD